MRNFISLAVLKYVVDDLSEDVGLSHAGGADLLGDEARGRLAGRGVDLQHVGRAVFLHDEVDSGYALHVHQLIDFRRHLFDALGHGVGNSGWRDFVGLAGRVFCLVVEKLVVRNDLGEGEDDRPACRLVESARKFSVLFYRKSVHYCHMLIIYTLMQSKSTRTQLSI